MLIHRGFTGHACRPHEKSGLAWWIHDNLPYASQYWFPKLAAFNLRWSGNPNALPSISTYVNNPHTGDKKALVKDGVATLGLAERKAITQPWLASLV